MRIVSTFTPWCLSDNGNLSSNGSSYARALSALSTEACLVKEARLVARACRVKEVCLVMEACLLTEACLVTEAATRERFPHSCFFQVGICSTRKVGELNQVETKQNTNKSRGCFVQLNLTPNLTPNP